MKFFPEEFDVLDGMLRIITNLLLLFYRLAILSVSSASVSAPSRLSLWSNTI